MKQTLPWTRVPGLFALGAAAIAVGCDAPASPTAVDAQAGELAAYQAKKTGMVPSPIPLCPEKSSDGTALCSVEVNAKHGNEGGLPINLKGVKNGSQYDGNGNGTRLTVSVLGTLEFDLSKVDMTTVRVGDWETPPSLTPVDKVGNGKYQASIVDLNGDGILDLLLHLSIPLMVDLGNISETTTRLCLYGEGPGYVINAGCGGGGGGGGGGGAEPPPYASLPDCPLDIPKSTGKVRCAMIRPYGRDTLVAVRVLEFGGFTEATGYLDANQIYPGWLALPVGALVGGSVLPSPPSFPWQTLKLPLGNDNTVPQGFCPITPPPQPGFTWLNRWQVLVREDLAIPAGATNVRIEFVVDDVGRVYANGNLLRDWTFSGDPFACGDYARSATAVMPDGLLSADGINKLAVWAEDGTGGANFLDFRVFADVPVYKP